MKGCVFWAWHRREGGEKTQPFNRFPSHRVSFWGGRLRKMFCNMFSESSTGSWAEMQLPCCPSKQEELIENMLQNLLHNLPPQTSSLRRRPWFCSVCCSVGGTNERRHHLFTRASYKGTGEHTYASVRRWNWWHRETSCSNKEGTVRTIKK